MQLCIRGARFMSERRRTSVKMTLTYVWQLMFLAVPKISSLWAVPEYTSARLEAGGRE